jgi:regulation of enolase protein 1 (concanavalin A-like superfamily)
MLVSQSIGFAVEVYTGSDSYFISFVENIMRSISRLAFALCVLAFSTLPMNVSAQASPAKDSVPLIAGVPGPLTWQHPASYWKIDDDQTLTIVADKKTNWYVSPAGDGKWDSSNRLLFKPASDFVLSAKVTVGYHSTWDAGGLVLYANDSVWAKFGIEVTSEKKPTIVSVVTRTVSDDNNSIVVNGSSAYLKIAKAGSGIFFYESEDGQNWSIIRAFSLGDNLDLRVGFSAQSPIGDGCRVEFSQIQYQPRRIDLWAGK